MHLGAGVVEGRDAQKQMCIRDRVYILANGVTKAECDEKVAKYAAWAETLKG